MFRVDRRQFGNYRAGAISGLPVIRPLEPLVPLGGLFECIGDYALIEEEPPLGAI